MLKQTLTKVGSILITSVIAATITDEETETIPTTQNDRGAPGCQGCFDAVIIVALALAILYLVVHYWIGRM